VLLFFRLEFPSYLKNYFLVKNFFNKNKRKMATAAGQLLFDESGQPFILIREQERQKRLTGVEALKVF